MSSKKYQFVTFPNSDRIYLVNARIGNTIYWIDTKSAMTGMALSEIAIPAEEPTNLDPYILKLANANVTSNGRNYYSTKLLEE